MRTFLARAYKNFQEVVSKFDSMLTIKRLTRLFGHTVHSVADGVEKCAVSNGSIKIISEKRKLSFYVV